MLAAYDDEPVSPGAGKRKRRDAADDLLSDVMPATLSCGDTLTRFQLMERQKAEAKAKMEKYNAEQQRRKQEQSKQGIVGDGHIQNGGAAENLNNGGVAVKVEVEADDADVKSVNTSSSSAARAVSGVAKQPRLFDRSLSVGAKSKSRLQFVSPAKRSRLESQAQQQVQQVPAESDSDDNDMHDQSYDSDAFSDGTTDVAMTSPQPTKAAKKLSGSVTSAKIKSPRRKSEGSKPRSQSVSAVAAKKQERRKPSALTCESFLCCLCCSLMYACSI